MSSRRHERVSELFLKVCDMEPQQRRAALDLECPGDAAMRDDVLALAEGDRRLAGFLEGSGVGSDFVGEAVEQLLDDIRLDQVAEHPATIGRYRILDVLGEGGMGTVYKAEQEHPRRTVALKMIRRGVTSPRILRRFEHEAPARLSEGNRALRGDVETIFAKALEKDKQRRYQSAADFAADIRRYLDNEPVIARPATALYQLRKFARRNPALVGGIAVVFVVLIAATAVRWAPRHCCWSDCTPSIARSKRWTSTGPCWRRTAN